MLTAALAASVLLHLQPVPSLVVYFDGAMGEGRRVETAVQEAACPYVRAERVPLPIPFRVFILRRDGESQRYVLAGPQSEGLLTECKP